MSDHTPLVTHPPSDHTPYRDLSPVTQLYVSVDASTKESLKRIDRPLFTDYWQRFLDSLIALGEKVGVVINNYY